MPLVSVLMTSYNHARFIREAVESVQSQSLTDFELVIVDDASQDDSQKIISELAQEDKRIKPVFHRKNMGIARTINDGLAHSQGRYVAFIASDDLWKEDKLAKQLEILSENDNLIVWCNAEIVDGESHPTGKTSSEIFKNSQLNGYVFEDLSSAWLCGSSIMFKRSNIQGIKLNEDMKYLNDTQFYMDIGYKYEFYYIDEPLARYRLHSNNTSSGDIHGWYHDSLLLCIYFLEEYPDETSYRSLKNIFHKTCVISFIACMDIDSWNRLNLVYPLIITTTFMALTFKNISVKGLKYLKIKSEHLLNLHNSSK